jgi:putative transposase
MIQELFGQTLRLRQRQGRAQTATTQRQRIELHLSDLAEWLQDHSMTHVRGAPCHPQTQGKIERWHQTLKNRILLENYYLPGDLQSRIARFVEHYNHSRYHENLQNLTPADVYFGRDQTILLERERIKRDTIKQRRLQQRSKVA